MTTLSLFFKNLQLSPIIQEEKVHSIILTTIFSQFGAFWQVFHDTLWNFEKMCNFVMILTLIHNKYPSRAESAIYTKKGKALNSSKIYIIFQYHHLKCCPFLPRRSGLMWRFLIFWTQLVLKPNLCSALGMNSKLWEIIAIKIYVSWLILITVSRRFADLKASFWSF